MELIERYVNEVGRRLPKGKRDDICKELRSALDDALEGRSFGEPSESDIIAVLNEFGSPQAVATSYSGDRYLIGPELYPQFIATLRIVMTVLAGLVVLGSAIPLITSLSGPENFTMKLAGLMNGLVDSAITSLGIVVIVFVIFERLDLKFELPDKKKLWNPKDLPAVRDLDIVGRFDSIAAIVFPAIVLFLINRFRHHIGIRISAESDQFSVGIVSDSGGDLLLNDVFLDNLPWLNASLLLPMVLSVWLFWSGSWNLPTRLIKIALDAFGLYVFYRIVQGVIAVRDDLVAAGIPEQIVDIGARGARLMPIAVAIVVVISAGSHLYKAFKSST